MQIHLETSLGNIRAKKIAAIVAVITVIAVLASIQTQPLSPEVTPNENTVDEQLEISQNKGKSEAISATEALIQAKETDLTDTTLNGNPPGQPMQVPGRAKESELPEIAIPAHPVSEQPEAPALATPGISTPSDSPANRWQDLSGPSAPY